MNTTNCVLELPVYFVSRGNQGKPLHLFTLSNFQEFLERNNLDSPTSSGNITNWFVRFKSHKTMPFPAPKGILVVQSAGQLLFDYKELIDWHDKFSKRKVVRAQTRLEKISEEMELLKELISESNQKTKGE